tara:strand:+ start:20690 stop:21310 length:621 start_codon:yes stop_codon:yes gene_type:complete
MNFYKKKLIIFDLDGVLIDSKNTMKVALQLTSKEIGIKLLFSEYEKYLGLPFEEIMKKMGIKKNVNKIKKIYNFHASKTLKKIKINKNYLKVLKKLKKKYYLTIFTSKNRSRTKIILDKIKIFDFIITAEDVKYGKPNPEGINKIIKKFKVKKINVLFIGDSIFDYKASKSAKVKYRHAIWGYDQKINKMKNLKKVNNFNQIEGLF